MDSRSGQYPDDQTLKSFGLGKLDERSAASVSEHVEHCPECERKVAEMSADSFLGRMRGVGAELPEAASGSGAYQPDERDGEQGVPPSRKWIQVGTGVRIAPVGTGYAFWPLRAAAVPSARASVTRPRNR
jgi:anti-sigma factor RsiW